MNRRLPQAVAVAAALFALAASPALAAGQHKKPHPPPPPSAYNVYVPQVPTAKGPKAVGGGTSNSGQSGQAGQSSGQYGSTVPLSSSASTALKRQGGKDLSTLKLIATKTALGAQPKLAAGAIPTSERAPSALGAAVGIGSGPAALLAALIAGAILLFWLGRLSGRRAERR